VGKYTDTEEPGPSRRQSSESSRRTKKEKKKKGPLLSTGCLIRFLFLLALLAIAGLFHAPADLERFDGLDLIENTQPSLSSEGSLSEMSSRIQRGGEPIVLEEEMVNRYLAQVIRGRQTAAGEGLITFEGVAVDFREGEFEVLIRRTFRGRASTQTSRYTLTRKGDAQVLDNVGGSYGRLWVPDRFAQVGRSAFAEVARVLEPEIKALIVSERIEFSDGKATLVPFR